jgi:hypothetical protein
MPTPAAAAEARAIAGEVLNEETQDTSTQVAQPPAKVPEAKPEPQPETAAKEETPAPEEPEVKAERPARRSNFVPVSKANQWRHEANEAKAKAVELERQVAELRAAQEKAKEQDLDAIAKEIAGDDASPEVVKRILAATKPKPTEELQSVLALKQKLEEQAEEAAYKQDLATVLAKHPELSGHEESLREMAYAEGNERIPLDLLAYRLKEELNLNGAPPSAEGRSSQAKATPGPDFANLSDEQLDQLSDADMDKYIEWVKEGTRKRTGVRLR